MAGRVDQVEPGSALAAELLLARRGTAYFARKLGELPDAALARPSLVPGWTKAHVVAHVSHQARALARLAESARTEEPVEHSEEEEQRADMVDFAATLSPIALRNLFDHSAVHLSVEWRDLPRDRWEAEVQPDEGAPLAVSATVRQRSREVWLRALDLDNGAALADVPDELLAEVGSRP